MHTLVCRGSGGVLLRVPGAVEARALLLDDLELLVLVVFRVADVVNVGLGPHVEGVVASEGLQVERRLAARLLKVLEAAAPLVVAVDVGRRGGGGVDEILRVHAVAGRTLCELLRVGKEDDDY